MNAKLPALACSLGLVVVLAGCAGDGDTAPEETPGARGAGSSVGTKVSPTDASGSSDATDTPFTAQTIPPASTAPSADVRGEAPEAGEVDRTDPDAVGLAFVQTAWTSDTRVDRTPTDAGRRAAPLADDALGDALREATTVAAPGADWQRWVEHDAFTRVDAVENMDAGRPRDSADEVLRSWTLTIEPVAADGWTGEPQTLTVYVALSKSPDDAQKWLVTDLRSQS